MRSTFLTFCVLVAVALAAGPARGQTNYMEYVGSSGTANYNVAANWNELMIDPNTGKYVIDGNAHVPANNTYPITEEVAYIRNGAVVTVVNNVPIITSISVGEAGDVTKDTGGTIQPRPASTLEVKSGGQMNLADPAGIGYPTIKSGTFGASYDGTLNVKGGQFTAYSHLYIGTNGAANPGGEIPYQGTGYLNVSSGQFSMGWGGSVLYIGAGRISDTTGKRVEGIATFSGGNVSLATDCVTYVGYDGARGSLTVYEADPNVSMTVNSPDGNLLVGASGYFGNPGGSWGYHERSEGTCIQNAGNVTVDQLLIGTSHADGLFELNGGTFTVNTDSECRVGVGGGRTYGSNIYLSSGYGTLVINDGVFLSQNDRTKFIVGRASAEVGTNLGPGYGVFTINGGKADFWRAGAEVDNCLEIGHSNAPGASNAPIGYGELNVLGGSLITNKRLVLAKRDYSTGIFRVSKDAYVELGWFGCWVDGESIPTNHKPVVIVDVTATDNSYITVYQDLWLKGTLDVQTYGWRPREGDKRKIIDLDAYLSEITGDFEVFTSNITNGLPPDPGDPNKTLSAFLGTGIPGDPNTPDPSAGYYVTFRGYTAGDCMMDHDVDGGDLAVMGGNWLLSGKTWADGDFNDDGQVDGGDLALMGGNWMWSLPPAPEGAAIPEPATVALLALGGAALIRRRR